MENIEIKNECERAYAQIKSANERLKELRTICTHEETFEGSYQWRIGSIVPATICSYCGNAETHFETFLNNQHP